MKQKDIFLLPYKDIYILYAPLHRKAVYLNRSAGEIIEGLDKGEKVFVITLNQ